MMERNKVVFDDHEFEIAMVTYNRAGFVKEWIEHCYPSVRERNIKLSIYDSSTDDFTERYIQEFNEKQNAHIEYNRIDSEIEIGYKPMLPLLKSDSEYVWVSGDSRYHDFEVLDDKVFRHVKEDVDYMVLHIINNAENDGKIYEELNEFLTDCFVSMTCIGLSIYKTELFAPLKQDKELIELCNRKYRKNYAFGWIGYFLEMFQLKQNRKALFTAAPIIEIQPDKKIQSWFRRFYKCWCEDLCELMDNLPDSYESASRVPKETWGHMNFDSIDYICKVRKFGDLNEDTFNRYMENGMLIKVADQIERIRAFASTPLDRLEECCQREREKESAEFYRLCEYELSKMKDMMEGKNICIYGAGRGGAITKQYFDDNHIRVKCFYDMRADELGQYKGLPVHNPEILDPEKEFIAISLMRYEPSAINTLKKYGIQPDRIGYPAFRG